MDTGNDISNSTQGLAAAMNKPIMPVGKLIDGEYQRPKRIESLDGLRGIAVLMVMWFHLPRHSMPYLSNLAVTVFRPGYFAVDIFFVLSGFLITRILLAEAKNPYRLRDFYVKRFFRIFPIYYLLIGILACYQLREDIIYASLYLNNYAIYFSKMRASLHHTWSLAIEEHFYLLWPWLVGRISADRLKVVSLVVVPSLALATAAIFCLILDAASSDAAAFYSTPTRAFSLSLGAWLSTKEEDRTFQSTFTRGRLFSAIFILGCVMFLAKLLGSPTAWPILRLAIAGSLSTVVVALFIRCNEDPWMKPFRSRWLCMIGAVSYGLYLYHQPIYHYFELFDRQKSHLYQTMAIAMVLSVLAAVVSFNLIEKPLGRLRQRYLSTS